MRANRSREIVEGGLPLVILVGIFILGLTTLLPFMPAILWGVILSIALLPFHRWCMKHLGGRRVLATWVVAIVLVLVLVLPMAFLSRALIAFIPDAIAWLSSVGAPGLSPDEAGIAVPQGDLSAVWNTLKQDIALIRDHFGDELRPVAFWLIGEGRLLGTFVIEFSLGVILAAVLMHRSEAANALSDRLLGSVGGAFAQRMGHHAVLTVRSTVLGLLGSAAVQTAVATLAYYVTGLPHWPVLALLTFMLATIQIGPVLIWAPAAVWLWMQGEPAYAIGLALWGLVVVGLSDNVVRTLVVSRGAQLPALLAFLGAIGGLLTWGIVGIFVGPVIIAVCHQLLLTWLEEPKAAEEETPGDLPAA
jgi:predicted PurR-regulated permease PerM